MIFSLNNDLNLCLLLIQLSYGIRRLWIRAITISNFHYTITLWCYFVSSLFRLMSHIHNKDCREAEREFVTTAKQKIAFFELDTPKLHAFKGPFSINMRRMNLIRKPFLYAFTHRVFRRRKIYQTNKATWVNGVFHVWVKFSY